MGPGQCAAVSPRSLENASGESHWSGSGEERKSQRGQTRHRPLMSLLRFEFLYCHPGGLSIVLGNNEAAQWMYGCVFIESIANITLSIDRNLNKSLY